MAKGYFLVALWYVGIAFATGPQNDLPIPPSYPSRTSSSSSTKWANTTSTSISPPSQAISISSTITSPPTTITTTTHHSLSSRPETCISSKSGVHYTTNTVTIAGSTISLAPNETITTTDEYTSTTFCFAPVALSLSFGEPPSETSFFKGPADHTSAFKFIPTVTIINTKKTSVLVQPTPANTLAFGPPQSNKQPVLPAQTVGISGSGNGASGTSGGGSGNQGGDSGNQGGGGDQGGGNPSGGNLNSDRPPTMSMPGMGGLISSILAAHPLPSKSPGEVSGSSPGSSAGPGESQTPPMGSEKPGPGNEDLGSSGSASGNTGSGSSGAIVNNIPVAVGPSNIIIGGTTFDGSAPTSITVGSETFTLLPSRGGVILPGGMTLAAPSSTITPPPSTPHTGGNAIIFDAASSGQVEIAGSTYQLPNQGSSIITVSGSTLTLEPDRVVSGTFTAIRPTPAASDMPQFTAITVDGIPLDIGTSIAVIDGHTIQVGPGAPTTTLTIGTETIVAGPGGLSFPHTTVAPLGFISMPVTADGIVLSMAPDDVVISGTTYFFSKPTAVVVGTETVSIGPSGVDLASTTIAPPSATTGLNSATSTNGQPLLRPWNGILVSAVGIAIGRIFLGW